MSDSAQGSDNGGETRQVISNGIVRLYKKHYGRGPTECQTYVHDDLVVVVLGGGYTQAEHLLFTHGKWQEVRAGRQSWQDSMAAHFVEVIEHATERKVVAFMGANHQEPDLSIEFFLLAAR